MTNLSKTLVGLAAAAMMSSALGGDPDPRSVIAAELKTQGIEPDYVIEAPIPGLYEVGFGAHLVYISSDARFVVSGDIIELSTRANLTEERRGLTRIRALEGLDESQMVVFSPEQPKHTITVFTDIDCGYCRRLHSQIEAYNQMGIKVRYLFYPRSGPGSESWNKAVSVWCADDKHDALTRAKLGETIEPKSCESPVATHYELGQNLGIRGTPAMVDSGGGLIPGYLPPTQLSARLHDGD